MRSEIGARGSSAFDVRYMSDNRLNVDIAKARVGPAAALLQMPGCVVSCEPTGVRAPCLVVTSAVSKFLRLVVSAREDAALGRSARSAHAGSFHAITSFLLGAIEGAIRRYQK